MQGDERWMEREGGKKLKRRKWQHWTEKDARCVEAAEEEVKEDSGRESEERKA